MRHSLICPLPLAALAAFVALAGCGSSDEQTPATPGAITTDAGKDARAEASVDASQEEAGDDAAIDAEPEAQAEASVDAGADVIDASEEDAPADATEDAVEDAAEDAPSDSGSGVCTAGQFRCESYELQRCLGDGSGWVVARPCANAQLCDATAGRCITPACDPGEYRCEGAELQTCAADQSGWVTKETCGSPAHCRAEFKTCSSTPCPAGSRQCNDNRLQECNAERTDWIDLEVCASAELCNSTAGACTDPTCLQDEFQCDGANLRVCNFDSTGWLDVTTCASEALCDQVQGQCDVCAADTVWCDGANLMRCSNDGQQVLLEMQCAKPERCNAARAQCDEGCAHDLPGTNATCGANADQDCCARTSVPGGTFLRSYDGVSYNDPGFEATVSDFELDQFEVTVGRFREFVEAGMGTQLQPPEPGQGAHPAAPGSGWDAAWNSALPADTNALIAALNCDVTYQTWTDTPGANETKPINCVTWYEAFAFCAWVGGRLPTEAEWNYAAAGGSEQREYPWGSGIDHDHAVYGCESDGNPTCTSADITAVGSRSPLGDGLFGQADLSGSVWEWVLDAYVEPYPKPCVDCVALVGAGRARRGGSWEDTSTNHMLSGYRGLSNPGQRFNYMGVRCAR